MTKAANDTSKPVRATGLNIWALKRIANGRVRFPNRIEPTSVPHVRRCVKAGLVSICGDELELTEAGIAAVGAA